MARSITSRDPLLKALGHRFADAALLDEALTHRSAVDRKRRAKFAHGNERLEFLGDRVLALVVAEMLQEQFPSDSEGELAKRHAALVKASVLADVARELGLGEHLLLADNERASGGAAKPTILADACEAVLGALYRDGGLTAATKFVRKHWQSRLEAAIKPPADAKTVLQEWAQGRGLNLPEYREIGREGPAHAPKFAVEVMVQERTPARGIGRTKREAERDAATKLLAELEK
ncbi:MAG: rnc [Alphaproteobacteria bacterium]|nr:rnc [Alphaproteobacteria bacterium]